jgi:hypothetical protein
MVVLDGLCLQVRLAAGKGWTAGKLHQVAVPIKLRRKRKRNASPTT